MKLLVDMNLSPRWVSFLAASQIESVHWSFVGAATTPDSEIMAYARAHGYVVLTHDLDFSAILAATQGTKPSVVQIRSAIRKPQPGYNRSARTQCRAAARGAVAVWRSRECGASSHEDALIASVNR
jgi:predicted nuclease of predicted toxin-antitoxin system